MPRTSGRAYFNNDSVWKFLGGTAYELLELGRLRSGFEMTTFRVGRCFPRGMYSAVGVPIFREYKKIRYADVINVIHKQTLLCLLWNRNPI